jgi:hypothetical protein
VGGSQKDGSLVECFLNEIDDNGICDIEPFTLKSTWRNNVGVGDGALYKRLDHFFCS